jgi:hypothetical protein
MMSKCDAEADECCPARVLVWEEVVEHMMRNIEWLVDPSVMVMVMIMSSKRENKGTFKACNPWEILIAC